MIRHHGFVRTTKRIGEEIRLTKVLAECYQTDIWLHFQIGQEGLRVVRMTDEPMQRMAHLFHKPMDFSEIRKIAWKENEAENLTLHFTDSNRIYPEGEMTLYSKYKDLEKIILYCK